MSAYLLRVTVTVIALLFSLCPASRAEDKEVLRVGLAKESPPQSFVDNATGQLRGTSPELAGELAQLMGVDVAFTPMHKGDRLAALERGELDFCVAELLDERTTSAFEYIEFSLPPFQRVIIVHKAQFTIGGPDDFEGKRVIVIKGDGYARFIPHPELTSVIEVNSHREAVIRLDRKEADVFLAPTDVVALTNIEREGLKNLKIVGQPLESHSTGMLVRKGNLRLRERLKAAYEVIDASGFHKSLISKWRGRMAAYEFWDHYGSYVRPYIFTVVGVLLLAIAWNWALRRRVASIRSNLEDSEQQFKQLVASSPDSIYVVDSSGGILQSNDPGSPASLFDLVVDAHVPGLENFLRSVAGSKTVGVEQFRFRAGHEGERDVEIAAGMVKYRGREETLCCFVRDISTRKRLEYELIQSERLAVIGKMAACVAHEINNPLGVITSNASLLSTPGFESESESCLDAIVRNAKRAAKITRELMTLAQPKEFHAQEVDLLAVVRDSLSFLAPKMRSVVLSMPEPVKPQRITGDPDQLLQVFINLILNALQSMDEVKEKKLVIIFCDYPSPDYVRVSVQDSGCGIRREMLPVIFDPFMKTGKPGGFGLGLFVVGRIIEQHGGVIYVESEEGKGTRIILELPVSNDRSEV
jgi:signal transduction histidine kinase/ABC-type amino acid transport substrate-binding protein